jgi:hypothetical protein
MSRDAKGRFISRGGGGPKVSAGNKQQRRRFLSKAKFALYVFCASVAAGSYYGEYASAEVVESEVAAVLFLANHASIRSDGEDVVASLIVEDHVFKYRLSTNMLEYNIRPLDQLIGLRIPTKVSRKEAKAFDDTYKFLANPLSAAAMAVASGSLSLRMVSDATIAKYARLADRYGGRMALVEGIALAIVGGAGGYIGYKVTYNDIPRFPAEVALDTVKNPAIWKLFLKTLPIARASWLYLARQRTPAKKRGRKTIN